MNNIKRVLLLPGLLLVSSAKNEWHGTRSAFGMIDPPGAVAQTVPIKDVESGRMPSGRALWHVVGGWIPAGQSLVVLVARPVLIRPCRVSAFQLFEEKARALTLTFYIGPAFT